MKQNDQQGPSGPASQRLGLRMIVLAWVVAFALLIAYFNDFEQDAYNPNRSVIAKQDNNEWRLVLSANRQNHYVARGAINGMEVTFLVDTGATSVAIPAKLKDKLNLPSGRSSLAYTANGSVEVETTVINELHLGGIQLYNIDATLNPGMNYTDEILLGMNALKQLDVSMVDGELTIVQRLN